MPGNSGTDWGAHRGLRFVVVQRPVVTMHVADVSYAWIDGDAQGGGSSRCRCRRDSGGLPFNAGVSGLDNGGDRTDETPTRSTEDDRNTRRAGSTRVIVRGYMAPTPSRDARERVGAEAERQMAHYLHRRFSDDPAVCVLHQLRIEDADQPEQDGSAGVCQIDHLVVHRWGFFLVESKSVAEAVQVRSDGDGGDEWTRTYGGEQLGMPSPIRQVRRQSEFLRTLLQRHRTKLVGRLPFGLRALARALGRGDQRDFGHSPMQLVVAVSDGGRICRLEGWEPPRKPFRVLVKKADLVPEEIEREVDRHRTGASLLHVKPVGEYGLWSMEAGEVRRVAEFLAGRHVDRSAGRPNPAGRRGGGAAQQRYSKVRRRYPNAWDPWSPEDDRELLRLHGEGEDDRELLRLHGEGWSSAELSRQFGRLPNAIKSRLRKLQG